MVKVRIFTPEWADAFREALNANDACREAARDWVWPLALVLDREPGLGYTEDTAMLLELRRGECLTARLLPANEVRAPFVIRGDLATWRRIVRGELDPVAAIVHHDLRLDGSLTTLMLHTRAARALVGSATMVATAFPDGPAEHDPVG